MFPIVLFGQSFKTAHVGMTIGAQFSFGSHVNSVGITLNSYYSNYFFQINGGTGIRFNLSSYGRRTMFWENRNSLGLVLMAGKKESVINHQLDGLFHNTAHNYGLSYNYLWYHDNTGTSQRSGGWGVHIKEFSLLLENDVFGGQSKDRFRTGHVAMMYRPDTNVTVMVGLNIWTGETANSVWQKIPMDYCPSGFRCLDDLPYGRTSHGIVYGGIQMTLPYGQFSGFRIGVDSEKARHYFQNRLSHDLVFLPKKFKRNTPHYPRLDEHGCPTFERDSVRKDRFYFNVNLNENWSN
jgi:hypothetical protein